ncbi:Dynein assembly factor with WDR repeat domains 1 [Apostasia shenzhenica]|uniref:Dynein assembly factor with WDR repeat domains 1 n=1 Tax=Apostasia shenzhenica TaxID=1088818 RepID=A0A2I0B7N8_9ASPA|nr:Dynein assembly factor with WDR repeat domains 1 [Apostasia shenzhenica]
MSHPFPPGTVLADGSAVSLPRNPSSNCNHSPSGMRQAWEDAARTWLSSLPDLSNPSGSEIDSWIDSNLSILPEAFQSLPRSDIQQRILSIRLPVPLPSQTTKMSEVEFPYRFQRTDQWLPVYSWLESLDKDVIVDSKEVTSWLSLNSGFRDRMLERHSKYHLMHYIQKLHLKLLKKKGKLPKGMLLSTARASVKRKNDGTTVQDHVSLRRSSSYTLKDGSTVSSRRSEAFLRYELLTDLRNQLISCLSKHNENNELRSDCKQSSHIQKQDDIHDPSSDETRSEMVILNPPSSSLGDANIEVKTDSIPKQIADANIGHKRKCYPIIATPAWSSCDSLSGMIQTDNRSYSTFRETSSSSTSFLSKNIIMCLLGREQGSTWPLSCSHGGCVGRNQERWIPFFEGWRSLERQFEGPIVLLARRSYSLWSPTWCAYTSSVAIGQPHGRQGFQKVLDVKFHPEGLPQLVCSSNEAPNELLLYNLLSGRAVQLIGHNCQVEAVEFAARGASIVSCGSNLLKVWDCTTGSCIFTLGSGHEGRSAVGHTQKINAMAVNSWQSCLVVTNGGKGDDKLLLWNALRGELAADLNSILRVKEKNICSINAMEFCNENLLACGSDCQYADSAVVQLWDIESPQSFICFPANNSFITSLKVNPECSTIITGAGDGTVGLFDIRTCNAINYLSIGTRYEVTSVSVSSCGRYFCASSTSNRTLVWDTRLMPLNAKQMNLEKSFSASDMRLIRPLHCLSHGKQMPTAEHTSKLPGYVDEGDQGVNDTRWLHNEPVLITASGDGR